MHLLLPDTTSTSAPRPPVAMSKTVQDQINALKQTIDDLCDDVLEGGPSSEIEHLQMAQEAHGNELDAINERISALEQEMKDMRMDLMDHVRDQVASMWEEHKAARADIGMPAEKSARNTQLSV